MMIVIIRVAQIVVAWLPGWEKVETEKGKGGKRERVRHFDPGLSKVKNGPNLGLTIDQKV